MFNSQIFFVHTTVATVIPDRTTTPRRESEQRYDQGDDGFIVIVYDNDHNTWDEVVGILRKATGCTLEEANIETWEVDNLGKSVVHHGSEGECSRVANVIRTIGIRVEVVEE